MMFRLYEYDPMTKVNIFKRPRKFYKQNFALKCVLGQFSDVLLLPEKQFLVKKVVRFQACKMVMTLFDMFDSSLILGKPFTLFYIV